MKAAIPLGCVDPSNSPQAILKAEDVIGRRYSALGQYTKDCVGKVRPRR